mmetsp:Transcript_44890/g.71656  ORF Transcript_44890/g.71656 Transcript_44890/m.71656 type:complete len:210 (-) Transcript_44890:5535-6164(-)
MIIIFIGPSSVSFSSNSTKSSIGRTTLVFPDRNEYFLISSSSPLKYCNKTCCTGTRRPSSNVFESSPSLDKITLFFLFESSRRRLANTSSFSETILSFEEDDEDDEDDEDELFRFRPIASKARLLIKFASLSSRFARDIRGLKSASRRSASPNSSNADMSTANERSCPERIKILEFAEDDKLALLLLLPSFSEFSKRSISSSFLQCSKR